MALARAMTKRNKTQDNSALSTPGRATSLRRLDGHIDRNMISLPLKLLSTTNVHVYDNPDIYQINSSSASSTNSSDDSDRSPSCHSSSSISSLETSPIPSSPMSPIPPEPNHLTTYFQSSDRAKFVAERRRGSNTSNEADIPAVPSRALSHTKKSHQYLARKRSRSQVRSPPPALSPTSPIMRTSLEMFSGKTDTGHPFGAELAQVNELTEEFGASNVTVWDDEERYLVENGLRKFGVQDYIEEIQGLLGGVFEDRTFPMTAGWI